METTEVQKSQVLAVYSTFPALLETLFATFDVDRNGRIDLEAPIERLPRLGTWVYRLGLTPQKLQWLVNFLLALALAVIFYVFPDTLEWMKQLDVIVHCILVFGIY